MPRHPSIHWLTGLGLASLGLLAASWALESAGLLAVFALSIAVLAALVVGRSHAQATLAREEKGAALMRLQAIVDSMADGVIFVDADHRVALVNEAGKALKNLARGPGSHVKECHPAATHEMLDRVMRWMRDGGEGGPPHSIIKEKEGRFETTYAPVRSPGGAFLGVVMVIRDIAERRSLERRLLDAERLAAVGQMSAQVAHELRNPLNAIAGAAQYLERVLPDHPDVREYGALIDEEVRRVNRFIGELLKISRPANPVLAPSRVNRVVTEAARRCTLARSLPESAIKLELDRRLPPVDLDAEMISEAVVNLLDNALEAGGVAAPELATRFEAEGGIGAVVVEVRDRGCGIAADQLDEVVRPFVTTKATGTGLGLVIVHRAAEQHRATFALAPREGGGTVAALRLAVRSSAPTAAASPVVRAEAP
jgi:PAS domain S-box-containing protein